MTRIAIIGGHGKVARELSKVLAADGQEVTAIFRNPEHASAARTLESSLATFPWPPIIAIRVIDPFCPTSRHPGTLCTIRFGSVAGSLASKVIAQPRCVH